MMRLKSAILVLLLLINAWCLFGQQTVDRQTELAKPFECILVWEPQKSNAPMAGDTLGAFTILKIETKQATDSSPAIIRCLLAGYRTGIFPLSTMYPANTGSEGLLEIEIIAPDPDAIENYAPPKEIIQYYPDEDPFPLATMIAALMILLLLLLWWWRRRRKRPGLIIPVKGTNPIKLLDTIKAKWQADSIDAAQLGEGMMQSCYAFLQTEREVTTQKLARFIMKKSPETDRGALKKMLFDLDAWRFGKQVPAKESGLNALDYLSSIFQNKKQDNLHA